MKRKGIKKLLSGALAVTLAGGMAVSTLSVGAANEPTVSNYNQADGAKSISEVELLIGDESSTKLRGSTAETTVDKYFSQYLLGIASQFAVFIEDDFSVYEADTEGRVAVGGNFINNSKWGDYAVGKGDYATSTRIEDVLGIGGDFAHLILTGNLENFYLQDGYYATDADHSSMDSTTHTGDGTYKRVSINSDSSTGYDFTYFPEKSPVEGTVLIKENEEEKYVTKDLSIVDQRQLYFHKIIDFDSVFTELRERATALTKKTTEGASAVWGNTGWTYGKTLTLSYDGPATDVVYFHLDSWQDIGNCTSITINDINVTMDDNSGKIVNSNGDVVNYVIVCDDASATDIQIGYKSGDQMKGTISTRVTNGSGGDWTISNTGSNATNNNIVSAQILYDFPYATSIYLGCNFNGTILAPNADVKSSTTECPGHLSGALIAKSFEGGEEFGFRSYGGAAWTVDATLSKVDVTDNNALLAGAVLTLYDTNGDEVDSWKTTGEDLTISLPLGTFTLKETTVPSGYKAMTPMTIEVSADGTVKVDGKELTDKKITAENDKTELYIDKVDISGNALKGATLAIYDSSSKEVYKWTSDGDVYAITGIPIGSYTLKELSAPKGYEVADDIAFTVNQDGTISVNGKAVDDNLIEMTDEVEGEKGALTIKKTFTGDSVTAPSELTFTITGPKSYSKTVKFSEFTSGSYTLTKLPVGEYTVTESGADVSGYTLNTTYSVSGGKTTVVKDSTVSVEITNKYTKNKVNNSDDDDDETVVTQNFAVAIQKNDIDGNTRKDTTYVLYKDYTDADGNAKRAFYTGYTTVTDTVTNDAGDEVTYKHRKATWAEYDLKDADEWAEIKALVDNGKIAGLITDSTGYAYAYGIDEAVDEDGETVDYNFKEIVPPTELLVKTTPIPFEIKQAAIDEITAATINQRAAVLDDSWGVTLTSTGEYIIGSAEQVDPEFFIEKVDTDGNAITGAELKITGTLKDSTAFEETIVSTDDKIKIQLLPGEYVLEEMTVPAGYKKAENISFKVDESGVVTCDGDHIKVTSEGLTAEQYIMFMVDEKSDPEKTSTVSTTVNSATTTTTTTTSVKTGDEFSLMLLVVLAVASMAGIVTMVYMKKKGV